MIDSLVADHERADWLGCWDELVQKAHFKILVCLRHIKQLGYQTWQES